MLSSDNKRLTEISICHRPDGLHEESRVVGYVALHPFVVLGELLTKYFVCGYGEKLYPLYMVPFEYALFIRDCGDRYEPNNTDKFQYHDLEMMYPLPDFCLADLEDSFNEYRQEYLKMLDNIKDKFPAIQKAINNVYILGDIAHTIQNKRSDISAIKETIAALSEQVTTVDPEILLLIERAVHNAIR